MAYIEFKNVSKKYYVAGVNNFSLQDINFEIKKGELTIIVGNSGSGKSAILNLLTASENDYEGKITVDRIKVNELKGNKIDKYRKKYIGAVLSDNELIDDMTILENIILALNISNKKVEVESLIKDLGFNDKLNYFPSELSYSDRIKATILQALCKAPSILLCDEIFIKMDNKEKKKLLKTLLSITKKEKITMIMTMDNDDISSIAKNVVHIKDGKIISIIKGQKAKAFSSIKW